jgi:hypothetical protein
VQVNFNPTGQWTTSGSNIYYTAGSVGIGTNNPAYTLDVTGNARVTNDALINGLTVGRGASSILSNTVFGSEALKVNTTGTNNVAVGYSALTRNTTGLNNTAIGSYALNFNTTGCENTVVGYNALYNMTTGLYNVGVGGGTMYYKPKGNCNIAIGWESQVGLSSGTNIGEYNVSVGFRSLYNNGTGTSNVAIGLNAMYSNTSGLYNTAVGQSAIANNISGIFNSALGYEAFLAGTSYSGSTAIGYKSQPTASNQIMLGTTSEYVVCPSKVCIGTTTSASDCAITIDNYNANQDIIKIISTTTGGYTGFWFFNKQGSFGFSSNSSTTAIITKEGNITAGDLTIAAGTTVGSVNLGVGNTTRPGLIGFNTYTNNVGKRVGYIGWSNSTNYLALWIEDPFVGYECNGIIKASSFNATSDYRIKSNIKQLSKTKTVDLLNPIEYDLSGGKHDMGFIAHEVQEIFPFLVEGEKDGKDMQSINYNGFIALLVKEVQDLKKENQSLKDRLDAIEKRFM